MAGPGGAQLAALNPLICPLLVTKPAGPVGQCFVPQRALDSSDSAKARDAKRLRRPILAERAQG